MDVFQVVVIEIAVDRIGDQFKRTCRGDFTLEVVERCSIGDSGFVAKGIGARD